jgi:hypothetical protein
MPEQDRTYSVEVTFTADRHADEHLRNATAIRAEVRSWLEHLGATVHAVRVSAQAPAKRQRRERSRP